MNRRPANPTSSTTPGNAKSMVSPARFAQLATILFSGVLVSSTLVTADSVSVYEGKSLPQVMAILIALLFAILGAMPLRAHHSTESRLSNGWSIHGATAALSVLVIWLWLSSFVGAQLGLSRLTWNGFWHLLGLIGFALGMRSICASPSASRMVLQLVLFCALFQSVYALHQYAISMPAARAKYLEDPEGELLKADIDAPAGSPLRAQYEARLLSSFEPSATFALTNSLAVLLSGAMVAWAVLMIRSGAHLLTTSNAPSTRWRHAALSMAALAWLLIVVVWLLTKSRTGVLAVAAMAVVATVCVVRLRRRSALEQLTKTGGWRLSTGWIIGSASVLIAIFAAMVGLLARDTLILSEAPKSIAYRLEYWQATSRMIIDHPWTGIGLGNFQSYYPRYKLPAASETIADPHNWCFDVAACLSLPVLTLVLVGLFVITISSWQQIVRYEQQARRPGIPQATDEHLHAADGTRAVWIGAIIGWSLTALLQMLAHESFDVEPSLLALLVSVPVGVLWSRSIVPSISTNRLAALLGLGTMLLALLASGSWQASGIALPMIALLAVAWPVQPAQSNMADLNSVAAGAQAEQQVSTSQISLKPANAHKPQPLLVVGMIIVLAAFLFQTWQPVNASWSAHQRAANDWKAGDLPSAVEHTLQSIAADPASVEPRRLLVQIYSIALDELSSGDGQQFHAMRQQIDAALDQLLQVGGVSYLNWSFAAQTQTTLAAGAAKVGESSAAQECLTRASEYNMQAIARYPSSVALHAQQATLAALLSMPTLLKQELDTAFELSQATPHLDRKLAMQQVWLPNSLVPQSLGPAAQRLSPTSAWVRAEPLCEALRSSLDSGR